MPDAEFSADPARRLDGLLAVPPVSPGTASDASTAPARSGSTKFRRARDDSKIVNVGNLVVRIWGASHKSSAPIHVEHVNRIALALTPKLAKDLASVLKLASTQAEVSA